LPVLLGMEEPNWEVLARQWQLAVLTAGVLAMMVGAAVALFASQIGRLIGVGLLLGGLAAVATGAILLWREPPKTVGITIHIDPWPVVSSYLGLFLVGAMFLALGMFVSSLVRSQMVAALIAMFLSLLFIVAVFW